MRYLLILSSLLLASPASAMVRVLMEGVPSTKYVLYVDTINARAYLSTGAYVGGIPDVALYVSSNTVWSNTATGNKVVVYASGTIVAVDLKGAFTGSLSGTASLATALAANPTDCGANEFANAIDAQGNLTCAVPPGAAGETNTYTSSKTFTAAMESAGFTDRGQATIVGTTTVQGNAFSVGGSTFAVAGGSATLAYRMTAGSFSGPLTGNVVGNVTGNVTGNLTGNADTATSATTATNLAGGLVGQMPHQTAAGATAFLPAMGAGGIVTGNGTGAVPSTGTLTGTANQVIITRTGSNVVLSGPQDLGTGSSPTFNTVTAALTGNADTATKATNIAGGAVGQIPYQSAADTTLFLPAMGAAGIVVGNGTSSTPSTATLTGTASQVTVTQSATAVTLSLPATINVNTSGTAASATANVLKAGDVMTGTLQALAGAVISTAVVTGTVTVQGNALSVGGSTFTVAGGSATVAYSMTASRFVGPLTGAVTGNADTATALAANPTDCGVGEFANAIAANGNLTCATPAGGAGETNTYGADGSTKTFNFVGIASGTYGVGANKSTFSATGQLTLRSQGLSLMVGTNTFTTPMVSIRGAGLTNNLMEWWKHDSEDTPNSYIDAYGDPYFSIYSSIYKGDLDNLSFNGSGDANTGIYFPTGNTNSFSLATGGAVRFTISDSSMTVYSTMTFVAGSTIAATFPNANGTGVNLTTVTPGNFTQSNFIDMPVFSTTIPCGVGIASVTFQYTPGFTPGYRWKFEWDLWLVSTATGSPTIAFNHHNRQSNAASTRYSYSNSIMSVGLCQSTGAPDIVLTCDQIDSGVAAQAQLEQNGWQTWTGWFATSPIANDKTVVAWNGTIKKEVTNFGDGKADSVVGGGDFDGPSTTVPTTVTFAMPRTSVGQPLWCGSLVLKKVGRSH